IAWNLKPASKPVAFGSSGRCIVSKAWFNRKVLARSVKRWPKLSPSAGLTELPVMPPSTWPEISKVSHQEANFGGALSFISAATAGAPAEIPTTDATTMAAIASGRNESDMTPPNVAREVVRECLEPSDLRTAEQHWQIHHDKNACFAVSQFL